VQGVIRPALGTLLFVPLGPGTVIGLVPWFLSRWRQREPLFGGEPSRWLGVGLFLVGLPLLGDAVARFVMQGRGTPAPVAPPRQLVVTGLYRYVRNPMYLGVLSMILGQALVLGSRAILAYGLCVALASHLFVVLYEERTLRKRFGAEYEAYCKEVHRWLPRWRAAPAS
jgi:protein-S-isoprenylcysteine O-methyltransferase Ste14